MASPRFARLAPRLAVFVFKLELPEATARLERSLGVLGEACAQVSEVVRATAAGAQYHCAREVGGGGAKSAGWR